LSKKKFADVDPEALDAFRRMVAGVSGVEMKGAAAPYTSINGNMYSAMSKASRIGLRLPKKELAAFIKKYDTELFEPFPGFRQKTYIAVPESMHSNTRALRKYFRMAYEYAAGLQPKPTTKAKK
jgi:hypothetical protein